MKSYEERLPLIDGAVEYLNGKFPPHYDKPDEVVQGVIELPFWVK